MPAADSDAYFATRNWQSRLGAWASQQSEPVASRAELLGKVAKTALRLALPAPADEQQPDPGVAISAPAALGRLPAVGRSGGTVGRRQRPHPRSRALAAHVLTRGPTALRPGRGRSRGCSLKPAQGSGFHVAQHPPWHPGRDPVFCRGRQLAGPPPHHQLALHGARRRVSGGRRQCSRGGLHRRAARTAIAARERVRGA